MLTTVVAALALLLPAAASGGTASRTHAPVLGVVPHGPVAHPARAAPVTPFATTCGSSPCSEYESAINQYFANIAAASGATSNVYSSDRQYWDATGQIAYQSSFAGSFVDNNPFPASGCDDGVDAVCLTDQQIQQELQNVLTAKNWHGSTTTMFFVMTPDGVGSCVDGTPPPNGECSTNFFCAYHSGFLDTRGEDVLYANEPFEATIGGCNGPGQGFPNNQDADTTINTISHEHNEAITDPWGDAWFASDGEENGDLCAWKFGPPLGTAPNGQPFNQVINGHDYSLQQEWSNDDGDCVQRTIKTTRSPATGDRLMLHTNPCTLTASCWVMRTNTTYTVYWMPSAPTSTAPPAVSGPAAVGKTLHTSNGSWNGSPTSFAYQWQRCAANGTGCAAIAGATSATYLLTASDAGHTVRSTVSAHNSLGSSPFVASSPTAVVVPVPAATSAPVVSGTAAVGKTLTTTRGGWNTAATFSYQWQRCAANGTGCVAIAGATASTHPLVAADAGHRLEAVVSATTATKVVIAVPSSTMAPRIKGRAKVGKRLTATRGRWAGLPASYRFQWLRCSKSGGKCKAIEKATHTRYRVTKRDARHRLRVRVTARNAAGSHRATSRATGRVPALHHG